MRGSLLRQAHAKHRARTLPQPAQPLSARRHADPAGSEQGDAGWEARSLCKAARLACGRAGTGDGTQVCPTPAFSHQWGVGVGGAAGGSAAPQVPSVPGGPALGGRPIPPPQSPHC